MIRYCNDIIIWLTTARSLRPKREGGRRGPTERPGPYGHWSLYSLHVPSPDDVYLSPWTIPFASTTNRARVIFYHEGLLVGSVPCLRSLPAVVALSDRLNLE